MVFFGTHFLIPFEYLLALLVLRSTRVTLLTLCNNLIVLLCLYHMRSFHFAPVFVLMVETVPSYHHICTVDCKSFRVPCSHLLIPHFILSAYFCISMYVVYTSVMPSHILYFHPSPLPPCVYTYSVMIYIYIYIYL